MSDDKGLVELLTATWPERYYMSLDGSPFAAGFLQIGTKATDGATEYVRADLVQVLSDRIAVQDALDKCGVTVVAELIAELRNARMMVNYGNGDVRDEPDPLHERAADQLGALSQSLKHTAEIVSLMYEARYVLFQGRGNRELIRKMDVALAKIEGGASEAVVLPTPQESSSNAE